MKQRRYHIAAALLLSVWTTTGCSRTAPPVDPDAAYTHVEADEAARLIDSGDYLLIDVRTEVPFSMEHIPGAINIPYDSVSGDPDEIVPELPDKEQPLIIYCEYGGASKEVAEKLIDKGYSNIIEFDGLAVWEGELISSEEEQ